MSALLQARGLSKAFAGVTVLRGISFDLQAGEVLRTWADAALLEALTGYRPSTPVRQGVPQFVAWFRAHYGL